MAPQTSFEERLKRLQSNPNATARPAVATAGGGQHLGDGQSSPRDRKTAGSGQGGLVKWMVAFIAVFFICMAGLLYYTIQQTTGQAARAPSSVQAEL